MPRAALPQANVSAASISLTPEECAEIEAAVQEYLTTPRQPVDAMFDHVYAQLPRGLEWQREEARRFSGRR